MHLSTGMQVFACHQDFYQARRKDGKPIGRQHVWSQVLGNEDKHPRELLTGLIGELGTGASLAGLRSAVRRRSLRPRWRRGWRG